MLLEEIQSQSRVVTVPNRDGIDHTFVLRHVGLDANGYSLWLGKMKVDGEPAVDAAVVSVGDSIIAVNTEAPAAAIEYVKQINRKAYGPSLIPERHWEVRAYNRMSIA